MDKRVLDYDDIPAGLTDPPSVQARYDDDEPDRMTIHANGITVDVIANADGSVYVEAGAFAGFRYQAVVQHSAIDRYQHVHPSIKLDLAERRMTGNGLEVTDAR